MADQSLTPPQAMTSIERNARGPSQPIARSQGAVWLLGLFMISLTLGVSFELVGLRLSPVRLLLLAAFGPLMVLFIGGRLGRVGGVDWLLIGLCLWMLMSFFVVEGASRLLFGGISVIELFGSYLLGRYLVASADGFRAMVKWHLIVLAIMLPFAVVEFATGTQYWARILDVFGDVQYRRGSSEPRFGFDRALVGFDHPILFGVFCSMAAATAFYTWRGTRMAQGLRLALVGAMTFMSLSSGAVLSVGFQIALMIWGVMTRNHWKLLAGIALCIVVFLELASNRGTIILFIETMAFNQGTAWTRIIQWDYGSAEVMRNPIFGKGLDGDWERPAWLHTSSIDNYWLVVAFRHGLPAIGMMFLAMAVHVWRITTNTALVSDTDVARMRIGYLIVLVGVSFSLATVHIWDANVIFFFFFLGAGVWFSDYVAIAPEGLEPAEPEARPYRYSRFTPTHPPQGRSP